MRRTGFTLSIAAPIIVSTVLASIAVASPEGRYVSEPQHIASPAGRYVSEVSPKSSPTGRYVVVVDRVSAPEGRYVSEAIEIVRASPPSGRYVVTQENKLSLYQMIARLFQ